MIDHATPFPHETDGPSRCYALIPSAGHGSRAGRPTPKQYQPLAGARLIDHTLAALMAVPRLAGIGVVVSPQDSEMHAPGPRVRVWHVGGETRAHSVFNGLLALQGSGARAHDWVLVHDAARCLLQPQEVDALIDACLPDPVGGLLALPVPDTLKSAQGQDRVASTLDRSRVWLAQTPQMFRLGALLAALEAQRGQGFAGITDEASAIELTGAAPRLVRGSAHNFKVTYPEDFALAEALLSARRPGSNTLAEHD